MAIAQTPSPLANILAAKTYNAAWFSGTTPEAQISAAIAAAVLDGATQSNFYYVFIPANFRGFNPALVTVNAGVQTYSEDDLAKAGVVTNGAFGAVVMANAFTGATNEAKITNAIAFAGSHGFRYVMIPESFLPFTGGNVTFNSSVQLTTSLNLQPGVYDARAYGGLPNAGVAIQLAAWQCAHGSGGGTVDARGFTGNQVVNGDMLFSVDIEVPLKIIFGPSTWSCQQANSAVIASLFGSNIEINLNDTTFILNDGQNQSNMFYSDVTAGFCFGSFTNGSATATINAPSRGVIPKINKTLSILGHVPTGGQRDNTTLNGGIDGVQTTGITLTSTVGFMATPTTQGLAGNATIKIDNEIITYTGYSGNVLTGVVRGAYGSTAAAHANLAAIDRVVFDNYIIRTVTGAGPYTITLDRNFNAPTMTAARVQIGPHDCSFTGTGTLDGNKPAVDTTANGEAIQVWFGARLKVERGIKFQNWDHSGVHTNQHMFAVVDGQFLNMGRPEVQLGFSVLFFTGSKYCTAYGDYENCDAGPACDDRTTAPQDYDNSPLGCVFLPRKIKNVNRGVILEGTSVSFAYVPNVDTWGIGAAGGYAIGLNTPQWVTNGVANGNQIYLGQVTPTGQVGTLAAGSTNNFVRCDTPGATINDLGTTNTVWTVQAGASVILSKPMLVQVTGGSNQSAYVLLSPDGSTQTQLWAINSGSAAVPTVVGSVSNHPFGFRVNNLVRGQFDTSGNLVADTTNGGTFQDRLGSAAAVSKHVRVPFQSSGLSTASAADVSIASFSLPANALATNGQAVRIVMRGNSVTGAAVPNIKFGATTIVTGTITANNNFEIEAVVTRTGAATQLSKATIINGTAISVNSRATPAETLSGAVLIDFRGSIPAGTLLVDYVQIEYLAS